MWKFRIQLLSDRVVSMVRLTERTKPSGALLLLLNVAFASNYAHLAVHRDRPALRWLLNTTLWLFTNGSLSLPRLHGEKGHGERFGRRAQATAWPRALSMAAWESPEAEAARE